jgi:hypothetical protein
MSEDQKMQTHQLQLTDVIYNAANQCFEALVTVHDDGFSRKYACAIDAPISMPFADAAKGLSKQAMRRHKTRGGTYSQVKRPVPTLRAGRPATGPMRLLESLVQLTGRRAA